MFFENRRVVQRAFRKRLRASAVTGKELFFDAARIRTHPHGNMMLLYAVRHQRDFLFAADVPGIDTQLIRAVFHRQHGKTRREMNVRHDRNRNFGF